MDFVAARKNLQKELNSLRSFLPTATLFLSGAIFSLIESILGELFTEISSLLKKIDDLTAENKELKRQLGLNSRNSSKPPSSDGLNRPNKPRSNRTKTGKKPGGQFGHKGSHMKIPHAPDELVSHYPEKCQSCPNFERCKSSNVFMHAESRHVVEAEIKTRVIEHQTLQPCVCSADKEGQVPPPGQFPEDVKAYVQYGSTVAVLVTVLSTFGAMSMNRIHKFLGALLGVSLSTGTIFNMISRTSKAVQPTLKIIKERLKKETVLHSDETGSRIEGRTQWIHSVSNEKLTYQTAHEKRGKEGIDDNGVLKSHNDGTGQCVVVHDCWPAYFKYENIDHALCGAHLLRELKGITEYEPGHKWAPKFINLLMEMKNEKENLIDKNIESFSEEKIESFCDRYNEIIDLAEKECPCPEKIPGQKGRIKKGKERCLIERLKNLQEYVLKFIKNFRVPFDNNEAERAVRNVKTKMKVSGCFRTMKGAQYYLNIMSFIATAVKNNISALEALNIAIKEKKTLNI